MDDVMVSTERAYRAGYEVAVERVVNFAQQFGEAHLALACHGAFPLALTPDLLYHLWANFVSRAPWITTADVLLSPLCREVGHELYEMDITVRNLLLKELREDERFGQQRLNELADFLTDYATQQLHSDDPEVRGLAHAQQWTALAYTRPGEAARALAEAISRVDQEDVAEMVRVASLVETLADPLANFAPLIIYARGMADSVRGRWSRAATCFDKLSRGWDQEVRIAGVRLPVPESFKRTATTSVSLELGHLTPSALAARCRNTRPDDSHEPFCFELFRRAIAEGASLCWHYLYNQYYSLVRYWVSQRGPPDPDTTDDLTQDTLTAFWRFYTPDKLARARGLGDVLAYLKSCTAFAVSQARRRANRMVLQVEWDAQMADACTTTQSAEASAFQQMTAQHLWAAIEACCRDERERLVANLVFLTGIKPRQIAEQFPDLFPDVSSVYRVKRNLLIRLRGHPTIRGMVESRRNKRSVE